MSLQRPAFLQDWHCHRDSSVLPRPAFLQDWHCHRDSSVPTETGVLTRLTLSPRQQCPYRDRRSYKTDIVTETAVCYRDRRSYKTDIVNETAVSLQRPTFLQDWHCHRDSSVPIETDVLTRLTLSPRQQCAYRDRRSYKTDTVTETAVSLQRPAFLQDWHCHRDSSVLPRPAFLQDWHCHRDSSVPTETGVLTRLTLSPRQQCAYRDRRSYKTDIVTETAVCLQRPAFLQDWHCHWDSSVPTETDVLTRLTLSPRQQCPYRDRRSYKTDIVTETAVSLQRLAFLQDCHCHRDSSVPTETGVLTRLTLSPRQQCAYRDRRSYKTDIVTETAVCLQRPAFLQDWHCHRDSSVPTETDVLTRLTLSPIQQCAYRDRRSYKTDIVTETAVSPLRPAFLQDWHCHWDSSVPTETGVLTRLTLSLRQQCPYRDRRSYKTDIVTETAVSPQRPAFLQDWHCHRDSSVPIETDVLTRLTLSLRQQCPYRDRRSYKTDIVTETAVSPQRPAFLQDWHCHWDSSVPTETGVLTRLTLSPRQQCPHRDRRSYKTDIVTETAVCLQRPAFLQDWHCHWDNSVPTETGVLTRLTLSLRQQCAYRDRRSYKTDIVTETAVSLQRPAFLQDWHCHWDSIVPTETGVLTRLTLSLRQQCPYRDRRSYKTDIVIKAAVSLQRPALPHHHTSDFA